MHLKPLNIVVVMLGIVAAAPVARPVEQSQ